MLFRLKVDSVLFLACLLLFIFGLFIFGSAALGVLSVSEAKFFAVVKGQYLFALTFGILAFSIGVLLPPLLYKRYALPLFLTTLFVTCLVFVPQLAMYHGGAHRWIDFGLFTLQPSELIKFSAVVFMAAWCARFGGMFNRISFGLFGFLVPLGVVAAIVLTQPDFGTFLVIAVASFVVYFVGGARMKHVGIIISLGVLAFFLLIAARPYMLERVKTFLSPAHDPTGSSWQLTQSLISLGSGGIFGKGYGQSVQKFSFLPEPIGDSVFAVLGEELGFIGTTGLVLLFLFILLRGLWVALMVDDVFLKLVAVGIVASLFTQAFLNIGSMLRIFPLTGLPLPLVSHGGTALTITLFQLGVLLSISRHRRV